MLRGRARYGREIAIRDAVSFRERTSDSWSTQSTHSTLNRYLEKRAVALPRERSIEPSSILGYYSAIPLRDFLLDEYENFLVRVHTVRRNEISTTIRTPFDLMRVITERYLAMQQLRVLGNIADVEFDTAVRLNRNEITITVVANDDDDDDTSSSSSTRHNVKFYKWLRNIVSKGRTVERYDVTTTISHFFERSQTVAAATTANDDAKTIDSLEHTTRLLFVCLVVGCTFVRSVTTARNLVIWIIRMKRTLRLTNKFVVIVEREDGKLNARNK